MNFRNLLLSVSLIFSGSVYSNALTIPQQIVINQGSKDLYDAAIRGDTVVAGALLKSGTSGHVWLDTQTGYCSSLLAMLAYGNQLDMVKLLLQYGAFPDVGIVSNNFGKLFSPLHLAASEGNDQIVKELLKFGARVDFGIEHEDHTIVTPLYSASMAGH
jgi:hypothetical protein